jgi:hypothetical protein
MSVSARTRKGVVSRDAHQRGQERVALVARGLIKAVESVFGAGAGCELAVANGDRAQRQQSLVVIWEFAHEVRQNLEGVGVHLQMFGRGCRSPAAATEHRGMDEQVGKEGFAGLDWHGQQASCLALSKRTATGVWTQTMLSPCFAS